MIAGWPTTGMEIIAEGLRKRAGAVAEGDGLRLCPGLPRPRTAAPRRDRRCSRPTHHHLRGVIGPADPTGGLTEDSPCRSEKLTYNRKRKRAET